MGEPEIKFGDKIFLYGQFMTGVSEFSNYDYNSVIGYITVGGYLVYPKESDIMSASVPGFVADFPIDGEFTVATPFDHMEMVDVTDKLSRSLPLPFGVKVWMPIPTL